MGYSHEVAKKALIQVKNAGVVEAIDVIPEILLSRKEVKDKVLKSWDCPLCTFINPNTNSFCEVCES